MENICYDVATNVLFKVERSKSMIWGHDYSTDFFVKLSILIIALIVHFIRLHIKRQKSNSENATEVKKFNSDTPAKDD